MKHRIVAFLIFAQLILSISMHAHTHRKPGLRDNTLHIHAFTNARIQVSPETVYEKATLIIREVTIQAVGSNLEIPADAWVTDLDGKTIYPGFIEMYASTGLPAAKEISEKEKDANNGSRHWNAQIRSHYSSTGQYTYSEKEAG